MLPLWCKHSGGWHQGKFRFMNASLGLYITTLSVAPPKVLYVATLVYLTGVCISPPELDQVGRWLWMCLLPFLCLHQPARISKSGKTHSFRNVVFCSDSQLKAPSNRRRGTARAAEPPKPAWFWSIIISGSTYEPDVQSIPVIRWLQFQSVIHRAEKHMVNRVEWMMSPTFSMSYLVLKRACNAKCSI